MQETNTELANYVESKSNYINASCENIRVSEKEAVQALYNMTLIISSDESKLTNPEF